MKAIFRTSILCLFLISPNFIQSEKQETLNELAKKYGTARVLFRDKMLSHGALRKAVENVETEGILSSEDLLKEVGAWVEQE